MFEWETLEARQLSYCETSRPRWMVVKAASTCNCIPEWQIARVAGFLELSHQERVMVCEAARDATDRIVHRRVLGEMRRASNILSSAVGRFRKVWKCLPRATCSVSEHSKARGLREFELTKMQK